MLTLSHSATNSAEKWDVAVKYYDHFTNDYQDTNWRADVLTSAIEPLVEKDRKAEAQTLLVDFVNEVAGQPDSTELNDIFATYSTFLSDHYTPDEVRSNLKSFPAKPSPATPALQAWLYLADIETMTRADAEKYKADIKITFNQLNALYQSDGDSMSNYTRVKLADYNSKNGGNEAQARKVYEAILESNPDGEAKGLALINLAKIDAVKKDPASQGRAKSMFQRILNEVDDDASKEEAVLGIGRIEMAARNYTDAEAIWKQYRSNPAWRTARAEASYQYGVCLRENGQRDEAAATFVNVYSNFPGQLDWSIAAYLDAAKIIKSKGRDLDALKLLRELIQRMGHLKHPNVAEGRKLFFAWREALTAK